MDFFDEIERKITVLKEKDPEFKKFGASEHKYQFNKKLTDEQVSAFEDKFQIKLPHDYREFLIKIGNGGAGPCYGIRALDIHEGVVDFKLRNNAKIAIDKTFNLTQSWNAAWVDNFDWENERPGAELMDTYLDSALINGTIPICHYGHGNLYLLVVKGSEFGHIWFDGRADYSGIIPEVPENTDKQRITFSEWYQHWLHEA